MTQDLDISRSTPPQDPVHERARERAETLQGYYIHLLVYLVVNAGLFLINFITTGGDGPWWFQWTILGWGIGLAVHTIVVVTPVFGTDWVDRKAQRLVDRQRR
ncbi:MAG: 2TM domain-containing protein [Acidimicrobiia bacterium]|nr:2TM domain-containing protein [Acidimicrobiia bacterium]